KVMNLAQPLMMCDRRLDAGAGRKFDESGRCMSLKSSSAELRIERPRGKASIYKCGRIALQSPITRMSRRPNVHYGSLADIEVCIINVCFALLKQTFFNTVFMSAKCQ